jgi:hypothetical protein
MGNSFYSVTGRVGLDITPLQKSLATAQAEIATFKSGLSKMLKAGGMRGFAKFLGIGAGVYAIKELFAIAKERTEELQAKQKESIDQAYAYYEITKKSTTSAEKIADAWERTQKAVDRSMKMQQNEKDANLVHAPGGLGDMAGDAANHVLASAYRVYNGFTDVFDNIKNFGSTKDLGGRMRDTENYESYLESQPGFNAANAAQAAQHTKNIEALRAEQVKQAAEQEKINDRRLKLAEEKAGAKTVLDIYQGQVPLLNQRLQENKYGQDAAGQSAKTKDMEQLVQYLEKIDELQKKVAEEDTKSATEAEKKVKLSADIAKALEKEGQVLRKDESITTQIRDTAREWLDINMAIADETDDEKRLELIRQRTELESRETELMKEQSSLQKELIHLQDELVKMKAEHAKSLHSSLAPTEEEIRSGKRGTDADRMALEKADRKDAEARRLYDQGQRDKQNADASGGVGFGYAHDPHDRAARNAQSADELRRADELAGEARALHNSVKSQESENAALTNANFDMGVKEITASMAEIKAELKPVPSSHVE